MNDLTQAIDYSFEQKPKSSLVRRLVLARDDALKLRARRWLAAMDDQKLLDFGLSRGDVAALRGFPMLPWSGR